MFLASPRCWEVGFSWAETRAEPDVDQIPDYDLREITHQDCFMFLDCRLNKCMQMSRSPFFVCKPTEEP